MPNAGDNAQIRNHANLIWGVAELLRGDYKRADYGKVILPLAVMRRLDQVLEPTRDAVRERAAKLEEQGIENREPVLRKVAGQQFFNTHPLRGCHNASLVTLRSRDRCSRAPIRRGWSESLPGVRTRQLMTRNNELFEELREELRLNREAAARNAAAFERNAAAFERNAAAFDRNAAAFDRNAAAFDRNTQGFHRHDDVIRAMLADMEAGRERLDRRTDAVVGALADLAAEIRSWRGEGGPGPAG